MTPLFFAITVTGPAWALCEGPVPRMLPPDGSLDVPLDATPVWVTDTETPLILSSSDGDVAIEVEWVASAGDERYGRVRPLTTLTTSTTYVLGDGTTSWVFTTGSRSGGPTPSEPVGLTTEARAARPHQISCDGLWESEEHTPRASVSAHAVAVDGYLEARLQGEDAEEHVVVGGPDSVYASGGGCGWSNVDALLYWEEVELAVRAVDLAGRAGPWSDEETVAIPWPVEPICPAAAAAATTTGCAHAQSGGMDASAMMLALGVLCRRRRPGIARIPHARSSNVHDTARLNWRSASRGSPGNLNIA